MELRGRGQQVVLDRPSSSRRPSLRTCPRVLGQCYNPGQKDPGAVVGAPARAGGYLRRGGSSARNALPSEQAKMRWTVAGRAAGQGATEAD